MENLIMPRNYEEWRHCITIDCGLELGSSFIEQRIFSLQNHNENHTKQFIRLYGEEYHKRVLGWFMQARETL